LVGEKEALHSPPRQGYHRQRSNEEAERVVEVVDGLGLGCIHELVAENDYYIQKWVEEVGKALVQVEDRS
jgi:hypothetical protein